MAKISSYPFATPPTLSSYVIGTVDISSKDTKNFRISDVLALAGAGLYVPYTGATGNVDLGSNSITSNQFIRLGGTSSQFLKADGSVDSNVYLTATSLVNFVPYTGATANLNLGTFSITANSIIKVGGGPTQFLKADGSVDSNSYLTLSAASTTYVPYTGATANISLGVWSLTGYDITAGNSLNTNGPFKSLSNAGTAGQLLVSQGPIAAPIWQNSADAVDLYKGSFYDSLTQTATAVNTATTMILRQTDVDATLGISVANGSLGLPTRVTVTHTGVYTIFFSAQLERLSGGSSQTVDIWLRKNGTNVPSSNGKINVQANAGYLLAAWNYFIKLNAGDYIELMWATTSTAVTLHAAPIATIHPETPSIILTINQV
jgi:hypothetical protein